MTPESVLEVMQKAIWTAIEAATPLLAVGITVGLIMGLIQAATQISEPALTFVPKLMALAGGLVAFGGFIIERLTTFGREMLEAVGNLP